MMSAPTQAETIRIGGTGNALGTMHLLAQAYHEKHPEMNIIVLPSIGSSGGIKAVPTGAIDIGLSARPLKKKEKNKGIIDVEYARSPTVIAISKRVDIKEISVKQLIDIYSGQKQNWKDGTHIRPIMRQANDSNSVQLKSLSPQLKMAIEIADQRPGILFASTDQEAVGKIQEIPGSFGVTSLALILSEKRPLQALALDGIMPSTETMISGQYPIIKHFYFILPEVIPDHIQAFLMFIESQEGTQILEQNGNLAV